MLVGDGAFSAFQNNFNPWAPSLILYNPVGKTFMQISVPDTNTYAFRLADLVTFSRLLELQRRIAVDKVQAEQVPAFLAGVDPALMNPYTEKPFDWDAGKKAISFAGHGVHHLKDGRMAVGL